VSRSSAVIEEHKDALIESIVAPCAHDIDTLAAYLGIDKGYLSVQVRLLLPRYSRAELEGAEARPMVRIALTQLRSALSEFEIHYKRHRGMNLIDSIAPDAKLVGKLGELRFTASSGLAVPVRFGHVTPEDGIEIQERIHYIHKARDDTAFHLGLFARDSDFPVCYCAVSSCDREYQREALSKYLGEEIPMEDVAVLTRAYGYSPLPANSMSKMFDLAARTVREETGKRYLITALNPFLGFKGSIFFGSSFRVFATSPMSYNYDMQGLYSNRRNSAETLSQNYPTPPILWLARPIARGVNELSLTDTIVSITSEEYSRG
jgi:hypothetical protein